jgi:hypothetical protein
MLTINECKRTFIRTQWRTCLVQEEDGRVGGHLDAHGHALALIGRYAVLHAVADHHVGLLLQTEDRQQTARVLQLLVLGNRIRQTTLYITKMEIIKIKKLYK